MPTEHLGATTNHKALHGMHLSSLCSYVKAATGLTPQNVTILAVLSRSSFGSSELGSLKVKCGKVGDVASD